MEASYRFSLKLKLSTLYCLSVLVTFAVTISLIVCMILSNYSSWLASTATEVESL